MKAFITAILFLLLCSQATWSQPVKTHLLKNDTLYNKYMDFYMPRIKTRIKLMRLNDEKKRNSLIKLDLLDAMRFKNNGEYHKALPMFIAIMHDYSPMPSADSAYIINNILRCYYDIKDLKNTLIYYNKLVKLKAQNPNIQSEWFRIYLSNIYYNMGFYDEALVEQTKEKKFFTDGPLAMSSYYNNRGLYWTKAGGNDSAMANFNQSIHYAERVTPKDQAFIALIKGNIGQLYMQQEKYREAVPLLLYDTKISKKDTNSLNVAVNYLELSICYNALNKPLVALQYLDSFNLIKNERIDEGMRVKFLKLRYEAYLKLGYKDSTINYFQEYLKQNTEYENQRNRQMIYNLKVSQEVFELQNEVREKKNELREKHAGLDYEKRLRRTYVYATILLSSLVIVILMLVFKLNRRSKLLEVKNKKITHQHDLLYKSLNDKEVLIKEIHHRVKNNLQVVSSLIRLQLNNNENEEIKTALSETNDRIISMSLLHQQLMIKNDQSVIEISGFILMLVKHLQRSLLSRDKTIDIEYDIQNLYLPIDVASPICLIVNEALVNCIKHAFEDFENSHILIRLRQVNNHLELQIKDNGKGFDYAAEKLKGPSLGLEIIETLSEQLGGKAEFTRENGTVFRLVMPHTV